MLIIFGGLPGTGKTTIAREVARRLSAVYLRVDTLEGGMRECGLSDSEIGGMGYLVGCRLATENLRLGLNVVADCVNPWELTRDGWRAAATSADVSFLEVGAICSDEAEHRRRVETRTNDIKGLNLPSWSQVRERDYHPRLNPSLCLDTARLTIEESVSEVLSTVAQQTQG